MEWNLSYITKEDFKKHVADTIGKYGEKLKPIDIQKFNKNLIDPVKLIFDKTVYHASWDEIIGNEIFRQRDKSNNNDIGYFHQRIFNYIDRCQVPDNGTDGGWDVIVRDPNGIQLPDGERVRTVYVEMKNKHNTMNSASAGKTYIKMQHQLLEDDDCACFLVEAIAQRSQNIKWETTVDRKKVSHKKIRRVSIDQFYSIVTGVPDAFYQMCKVLPEIILEVMESFNHRITPQDTVLEELKRIADIINVGNEDLSMAMAIYLLGFSSYKGFKGFFTNDLKYDLSVAKDNVSILYEYAKRK